MSNSIVLNRVSRCVCFLYIYEEFASSDGKYMAGRIIHYGGEVISVVTKKATLISSQRIIKSVVVMSNGFVCDGRPASTDEIIWK